MLFIELQGHESYGLDRCGQAAQSARMTLRPLRFLLASLILALNSATALMAQSWTASSYDNGFRVYGRVLSGAGLSFACYGPSQGGVDIMTAEAHEDAPIPRGTLLVNIGAERIPVTTTDRRSDIVFWVDGTGYRLPEIFWNELDSAWQVTLGMTDALIARLRRAQELIVAGGPQSWQFPVDGLSQALDEAMVLCNAAWTTQDSTSVPSLASRAQADVTRVCGGAFTAEPQAVTSHLIDGDTVPDTVIEWSKITCQGGLARPFCGASHCSVWIYPSTRGGAHEDLLAQAVEPIELSNGRVGLSIHARQDGCPPNALGCARIWYWTGTTLDMLPN